jgi:hypothetical protein
MAQTLTNERSLLRRQDDIARELAFLKRMRVVEWAVAVVCLAAGLLWKFAAGGGWGLLILGAFLVFLTLGHEERRKESVKELADTEGMRGAKAEVARLLDEKLSNDHFVLNDLHLKVGREKCWIDHLVVAPSGMFIINTLNWSGKIIGDTAKQAHVWKIRSPDGKLRPARNPVGKTLRERRILCNWLKGTNLIWERVYPLVILAHPGAEIQVTNAERRVLVPGQAVTFINDFCFEKPVLSNAEVEKLARGLNDQQDKA